MNKVLGLMEIFTSYVDVYHPTCGISLGDTKARIEALFPKENGFGVT